MFRIQYKVFTNLQNPNSKTEIRKPWAKNRLSKTISKPLKTTQKENLWALPMNPQIYIADTILGATTQKPITRSLEG